MQLPEAMSLGGGQIGMSVDFFCFRIGLKTAWDAGHLKPEEQLPSSLLTMDVPVVTWGFSFFLRQALYLYS